uniref:exo-alpha-sialidase n=1 Tax=Haplochromis burtoni TaxID=8153 RepID=A0A3Q2V614_HAPBU
QRSPSQLQKQTLFTSNETAGNVYRIPALLYERESKTLFAFAEQRKTSDNASGEKLVIRTGKIKEGSSKKTALIKGYRPMNPYAITEMYQKENCDNRTRLCFITSEDLGETWSDVTDLTDKLNEIKNWSTFAVGPGHGIPAESGRLIIPVYAYTSFCCKPCFLPNSKSYALSLYSGSHGKNWKFGELFNTVSVECEIVEISKDHIYCNARNVGGYRVEAVSDHNGVKFNNLQPGNKLVFFMQHPIRYGGFTEVILLPGPSCSRTSKSSSPCTPGEKDEGRRSKSTLLSPNTDTSVLLTTSLQSAWPPTSMSASSMGLLSSVMIRTVR